MVDPETLKLRPHWMYGTLSRAKSGLDPFSSSFSSFSSILGVSREYLYGLFKSPSFRDVFATLIIGTSGSHQRVKPEYLLAMDAEVPSKERIANYTALVKPLHGRVALNLEESRTLAALRDTLLAKLLSGEIRVKHAERVVQAAV